MLRYIEDQSSVLKHDLGKHCIRDYACYNEKAAKDYLRTAACAFYEILKTGYREKIYGIYELEEEIAEEAVRHTLDCWNSFNVRPTGDYWEEELSRTIVQHVGRQLGRRPKKAPETISKSSVKTEPNNKSKRPSAQVNCPSARRLIEAYIQSNAMSLTDLAIKAQTTDRSLRRLRTTGKIHRDILKNLATVMGRKLQTS